MTVQDIHPLKALTLVNESARRSGDRLVADCPCCGWEADIVDEAFVCSNSGCRWSRGGSIDYLAEKTGSYTKAVGLASILSPVFREGGEQAAEEFEKRRSILNFFIKQEDKNNDSDHERIVLRNSFRASAQLNSSTSFPLGNLYLTQEESNELTFLLADADITPPPNLQGRPAVVAPYWAFPHVLSSMIVMSGAACANVKSVEVFPHRYSWFGLSQKNPRSKKMYIFPRYIDAMDAEHRLRNDLPEFFPTHLMVQVTHKEKGMVPDGMIFQGSQEDWYSSIPSWSFMDGFDRAEFHDAEGGVFTLPELMVNLLDRSGREFNLFLDLCAGMNMDATTRSRLMSSSYSMFDADRAHRLRNILTRRLILTEGKTRFYETAEGYEAEVGGDKKRITTFTLDIDSIVAFSQNQDVTYNGRIITGEEIIAFAIPGKSFDSSSLLERALAPVQIREGQSAHEPLATIFHKKEFAKILNWIKIDAATKPRERGVRSLGWSRDFKQYITPDTIISKAGILTGVRYHSDPEGEHECYASGSERLGRGDMPEIDLRLAEMVSALIAQIIRFYHGHNVRMIPIVNNAAGRKSGLRMFSGLGQTEMFRLTNILPRNIDINRGMPCLVSGLNRLQAAKVRVSGLWLNEKGFDFEGISEEDIEAVASFLPTMIDEIAHRLLQGESLAYREKRSVDPFTALAIEGADVIRESFWPEWPEAGRAWSAVDKMLGERELEIQTQAKIDETKDAIMFPPSLWDGLEFNRMELIDELGRLCQSVDQSSEDFSIYGDRTSIYRIFNEFYGEVPRLAVAS